MMMVLMMMMMNDGIDGDFDNHHNREMVML
jgi:hypothetical protein